MSLSISTANPSNATYDSTSDSGAKTPLIKPSAAEQIQQLASAGEPAVLIASSLAVTVSYVDTTLGITDASTSQASALGALSGRLSVHA